MSIIQSTFAVDVAKLILFINEQGYTCTGGEWLRTKEMAEIYAKRGTGIERSRHCDRMAWDFCLFKDGVYLKDTESYRFAGEYFESLSPFNRWGGRYGDGNHVERLEVIRI